MRVGFLVAQNEKCLRWCPAHEGAVPPEAGQERADVPADRLPQRAVVRFENDPAGAFGNRFFDHAEQTTNIEVSPFATTLGHRPGAPDADALTAEQANAVDATLVQRALFLSRQAVRQVQSAAHCFV